MSGRLQERVAIITGAGRSIGEAIARRFVQEGAKIVVAAIDERTGPAVADRLGADRYPAHYVATDVASVENVERMVSSTPRSASASTPWRRATSPPRSTSTTGTLLRSRRSHAPAPPHASQ